MTLPDVLRVDGDKVYFNDKLLEQISGSDFERLAHDQNGTYVRDRQGVWLLHQYGTKQTVRFVTKQSDEFHYLDGRYSADGETVFYDGVALTKSDPNSFQLINQRFARDRYSVYVSSSAKEGLQIWTDFDPNSVQFFGPGDKAEDCFADRFQMYRFNGHFVQYVDPHSPAHEPQKQALLGRFPKEKAWWTLPDGFQDNLTPIGARYFANRDFVFYRIDANVGYCCQYQHSPRNEAYLILPNAAAETFVELGDVYGANDTQVYCRNKRIEADRATFQALEGAFGQDKNGLWFNGFLVPEINIQDLEIRSNSRTTFAMDNDQLFCVNENSRIGKGQGYACQLKLEKNGDPKSFGILSDTFAKDVHQVYCHGQPWKIPDPATFEVLTSNQHADFAKDKNYLFSSSGRKVFKTVDGSSYQQLNAYWAVDASNVIYTGFTGEVMRHVDRDSFEVLDNKGAAQDIKKTYWIENGALSSKPR